MSTQRQNRKTAPTVLGLTLADGQLRAIQVARSKGGVEVVKTASAAMTLDLLHPEAELVGREIKNHLDAAGIRERPCIVSLPARWVMSQHTTVPTLSAEDTASFLEMEAEKGFPVDPHQLQVARSFHRSAHESYVTQLAVRKEQIGRLADVLRAAGLKPVSFSLGLAALPESKPIAGTGRIVIAVETTGVTLLVVAGGGIAAFRTFDGSIRSEAEENVVNGAAVARELRITFEQVPAELRTEIHELFLTGDSSMVRQLTESLGDWSKSARLKILRGDVPDRNLAAQTAESLAVHWLENGRSELEFLPPRPSQWALLVARYHSKRLATIGAAAAALLVFGLVAFGWQEYRRWTLRSEWNAMQAQVVALDAVQSRIREFRPYYDPSFRSLSILKRVTECFPDNGTVTAKTFEVHGTSVVTISGTARDNAALLRVQDLLRKAKEVQGLKIEQIRGKTPMQFTLTFRWSANPGT